MPLRCYLFLFAALSLPSSWAGSYHFLRGLEGSQHKEETIPQEFEGPMKYEAHEFDKFIRRNLQATKNFDELVDDWRAKRSSRMKKIVSHYATKAAKGYDNMKLYDGFVDDTYIKHKEEVVWKGGRIQG
ncbi:hypothetical protein CYMTET_42815 [Cymbomonas tetramitiformis]|uniref:Cathepsin propeptide inhibitor domain-containing protein n=1 Tax=Cymbomonas tetramitiformis TaxID=36881 RepID=A0AAE0C5D4_9CHLO|nr:hypothetical protein CYMTET_42815 [Cymbomonas tetramitiformis]